MGASGRSALLTRPFERNVESDFELFSISKAKFPVVHCPRSHDYFGHSPFQFQRLRQLSFNICLGTDSLASNEDLSLFAEMKVFGDTYSAVSPREIVQMVTVNPARALKQEHQLGCIGNGAYADVIAIPGDGGRDVFE